MVPGTKNGGDVGGAWHHLWALFGMEDGIFGARHQIRADFGMKRILLARGDLLVFLIKNMLAAPLWTERVSNRVASFDCRSLEVGNSKENQWHAAPTPLDSQALRSWEFPTL